MKIVSWNINSVRARLEALLVWLERHEPDILCLQETKVPDHDFPALELRSAGYEVEMHGQKGYNGVAIVARGELAGVRRGFPGDDDSEKRVIAATMNGIRVLNLYVPNGKSVGSEHYERKLAWLDRFLDHLRSDHDPAEALLLCGDFNIAPEDRDTYDPELWRGRILASDEERKRFRAFLDWGLVDAQRETTEEEGIYTWWDYRMGSFRRNLGLRIDHFLVTRSLAERIRRVSVDREARGAEKPSDHAPLILELNGS